jgi:formamidopyrimidine-DNA glycosylase
VRPLRAYFPWDVPELPDITVYLEALTARTRGETLERIRLGGPSLLRSVDPPILATAGLRVRGLQRLGKRVVFDLDRDLHLVIHLMVAGRFKWKPRGAPLPRKAGLAAFDFSSGTLLLTEAGSKRRATLHVVRGARDLAKHDPGGLEIFEADELAFASRITSENRTLKRALTDPRLLSGIGNAYSDEILHAARLSPVTLTRRLDEAELGRLYRATRETLTTWTQRLRDELDGDFPNKVTAFRAEMAVHGRFRKPCPVCSAPVQRIVYASTETNYCANCQTGGRLLADRALSRLLRQDWPRSIEELEARTQSPDTDPKAHG